MLQKDFIDYVYQNNIFQLGTVTLKNGSYSDHFYNFGKVDSPTTLSQLSRWLVEVVNDVEFDAIFTSAYKGITIQTGFALEYGYQFPFKSFKFGYQRKEDKTHGEEGSVVGYQPQKGDRVLLMDDVFTTGFSFDDMIKFIRFCGATPVLAVVSVLRSDEATLARFTKQTDVEVRYLVRDDDVVSVYHKYRNLR